ncbi:hypothetical protein JTB14_023171 [Gonioctena quinquepunctata]|nr:hypothetical protein JTB14_023171 [Gonioctena quinquepunctata]
MNRVSKKLHNIVNEDFLNLEENISWIVYIASLTEKCMGPCDIEIASKILWCSYKSLYGNDISVFAQILKKKHVIVLMNYEVVVADKWLFQVILLNSMRSSEALLTNRKNVAGIQKELLIPIVECILLHIDVVKKHSIYLLRTLQFMLTRCEILICHLSLDIIKCMNKVALSPFTSFKQLAQDISKICIQFLSSECHDSIHTFIPVRGIETQTLLRLTPTTKIQTNLEVTVKRVLKMFSNSIESKDAGFLYEKLLGCSFENWKNYIWPLFLEKLIHIEYDGEFHQSLVKYWIPSSVTAYKTDFYSFLSNEPIDSRLKACVLLESQKQGYSLGVEQHFFHTVETRHMGLKLATMFRKKTQSPTKTDIHVVIDFLYSNLGAFLEEEDIKSLSLFFSHFFLYAHNDLKKRRDNFQFYAQFVNMVYKYSYGSLNSDFFEVGAQVLQIIWTTLTGSHKDLTLGYKMEKRDIYNSKENLLYKNLISENKWNLESKGIISRIRSCLMRNDYHSLILTNLILRFYSAYTFLDIEDFKQIIIRVEDLPTLENTKKIINCSNLLFQKENSTGNTEFIDEIENWILDNISTYTNEIRLFKIILYLEILLSARRNNLPVKNLEVLVEKCLHLIDSLLEGHAMKNVSYQSKKIFETFIARVLFCITQDLNYIWPVMNKIKAILTLKKIINKSNMKKPVSLSVEILRKFGSKMGEDESDKVLRIQLLNDTLETIGNAEVRRDFKMRRNPESRLVVHAMCMSQSCAEKPLLIWTMNYLLKLISNPLSSDSTISSSLHTIELLMADTGLQQQTLQFIPSVIINCVETFGRPNWIVRNADLQLAKSLIERLYGVSLGSFNRSKSIEDLFLVFPDLSTYFYRVLSSEVLDEKSVIVFHFFLESQVKESIFENGLRKILDYFQIMFVYIIKNYQNHYGRLAVRAYVSLCLAKNIPKVFSDITEYIMSNYTSMKKNIFANFVFLLQELYEKFSNSFEHYAESATIMKVYSRLNSLTVFLQKFDTDSHDFLLLKVKPRGAIMKCLKNEKNLNNRIWLNNNLSFVVTTTLSDFWSTYLETHYFINSWTGKSYPSILCGLKEFLSPENIRNFIGDDEYVKMFYIDLKRYLDKVPEKKEPSEDFYTEGGVKMLPKMFLKKLLWIVE